MYGQFLVCLTKMLLFGFLTGILNLFSVWIIYNAWATMHFCNLIFYMVFCGLDLLMQLSDFSRVSAYLGMQNTFYQLLYYAMIIFLFVAMFVSYKAYKSFK